MQNFFPIAFSLPFFIRSAPHPYPYSLSCFVYRRIFLLIIFLTPLLLSVLLLSFLPLVSDISFPSFSEIFEIFPLLLFPFTSFCFFTSYPFLLLIFFFFTSFFYFSFVSASRASLLSLSLAFLLFNGILWFYISIHG